MLKQDLPDLPKVHKNYALRGLARAGLTLADCLEFFAQHRSERELYYVKLAQQHFVVDGAVEVDDTAAVSLSEAKTDEEGAYVQGWLWVPAGYDG